MLASFLRSAGRCSCTARRWRASASRSHARKAFTLGEESACFAARKKYAFGERKPGPNGHARRPSAKYAAQRKSSPMATPWPLAAACSVSVLSLKVRPEEQSTSCAPLSVTKWYHSSVVQSCKSV